MARADDRIENTLGSESPFDIIIDDIGLNLFGDTPISGKFGPGFTTAEGGPGETGLIFNDYSNGMGMGYSGVPNTYAFAINGYTRTPRKFMPGGLLTEISLASLSFSAAELDGEIRCGFEWNGDIYIGAGRHILKLTGGALDGVLSDEYDMGLDTQIDSSLIYNGIPLFSCDDTFDNVPYLTGYDAGLAAWKTAYDSGGAAPAISENEVPYANPVYLKKMIQIFQEIDGVGGNRIFGNDTAFTYVQTQANDIDDIIGDSTLYSAAIQCGDTSYAITNIIGSNRVPFVIKSDGVRGIESSGIYCPNYTPNWADNSSVYNGISAKFFAGKVFAGTSQGLEMIDVSNRQRVDIPTLVSPSYFFANETPVYGIPTALTTDNGWLVVSLWNGTDSHICYTRPRETTLATTQNPMIWHGSECTIEGERITMLLKSSASGRPMMYIGTYNATDSEMHFYMLSLPTEGDPFTDYLNGEGHEFTTSCKLYLPFQDGDDPNAKKVIRRFDVQADGLSFPVIDALTGEITETTAAGELVFYANADAGSRIFFETVEPSAVNSEWVYQGTVSTSPKSSMLPATETTSGSQIGIVLVGELQNQGTAEVPIYTPFAIRSVKIRTDIVVDQLEERSYNVQICNMKATKTGYDLGDARSKFESLIALQNEDTVYMVTELKQRVLARIEPGLQYKYIQERETQDYSIVMTLRVTFLGQQFIFDIGQPYDSVYAWGA